MVVEAVGAPLQHGSPECLCSQQDIWPAEKSDSP